MTVEQRERRPAELEQAAAVGVVELAIRYAVIIMNHMVKGGASVWLMTEKETAMKRDTLKNKGQT